MIKNNNKEKIININKREKIDLKIIEKKTKKYKKYKINLIMLISIMFISTLILSIIRIHQSYSYIEDTNIPDPLNLVQK